MLVFGVHHWDQEEYAFVLKTQNSYQLKAERLDNDNRQHENVKKKKECAPPGNRTRVARMGILHDTTTPAARWS